MADETILVVDDSPTILKLVQLVLTSAGYRVATASGGEAGLVAARTERPRLVLVDYLMPGVNGHDLCRAMSEDPALSGVKVVVMSAREDEVGERLADMGNVADYITKPFSPEALLAMITHVIAKGAGGASEAPDGEPATLALASLAGHADLDPQNHPSHAEAALTGDLAVIPIADVLSLLADQAQTGVLVMEQANLLLKVFLRGGRIDAASARGIPDEFLLGRFLIEAGEIAREELQGVIEDRASQGGGGLLGAELVRRGLVFPAGLKKAMALQTSALVYEGLRWGAGRFWFFPDGARDAAAGEAALGLPVDALIMEGLRRIDEWRLIEREIGDFEQVFVRNEEKVAAFGRGKLLREELAVLEFVNGKNTVKEIIAATKMGSFDVTKMLFRLLRGKLVRRRVTPLAV